MKNYTHRIVNMSFKKLSALAILLVTSFFSRYVYADYSVVKLNENGNQIKVLSADDNGCTVEIQIGDFRSKEINIEGVTYNLLDLSIGSLIKQKGYPELPKISRSIIIPHEKMSHMR